MSAQVALDQRIRAIADALRILPAATAANAVEERERLTTVLAAGDVPVPRWQPSPRRAIETR